MLKAFKFCSECIFTANFPLARRLVLYVKLSLALHDYLESDLDELCMNGKVHFLSHIGTHQEMHHI